ncbi:hypothetical protein GCM10009738_65750 [Kitasatospora viridis]|uniref:Uncharacterized protein n=2 Tax=Kitasatospora viridis TaxID=281105 RepID=A0A561SA11_9ACTN|nr:hypothetical protein FHX73_1882 [Kitasatospora viridis]
MCPECGGPAPVDPFNQMGPHDQPDGKPCVMSWDDGGRAFLAKADADSA